MWMRPRHRVNSSYAPVTVPILYLNGVAIKTTSKESYLGVDITDDFKDDSTIEKQTRGAYARGNMLVDLVTARRRLRNNCLWHTVKVFIVLHYGIIIRILF